MATGRWEIYPDFAAGCNCYYDTQNGVVTWTRPTDLPGHDYATYTPRLSAGQGGGSKELEGGAPSLTNNTQADSSDQEEEESENDALSWAEQTCRARSSAGSPDAGDGEPQQGTQKPADEAQLSWVNAGDAAAKPTGTDASLNADWYEKQYKAADTQVEVVPKWVVRAAKTGEKRDDLVAPSSLRAAEDDLTQLDSLDPKLILFHLQKRFAGKKLYTNIGPIVVALNPLLTRQNQQVKETAKQERGVYKDALKTGEATEPHVYVTAHTAHAAAMNGENQGIIISGESGSGKTFATKMMLKYIMGAGNGGGGASGGVPSIEKKINAANPVLEAFGNAKTRNNDNSSRFGKYLKVFLDENGAVTGAKAEHYLLEKVRVVDHDHNERNYHIFYMLLAPLPADGSATNPYNVENLGLTRDAQQYRYLKHDAALATDRKDFTDFQKMQNAFTTLGFSPGHVDSIFRVLAGILHCGNMTFKGEAEATIDSPKERGLAAQCFGVTPEALEQGVCKKLLKGTYYARPQAQAEAARDTLCKYLYGYVFDFIMAKVNGYTRGEGSSDLYIGCLDIFGFEDMANNSLEQLCINYTNEKLQEQFNNATVKQELALYKQEGLNVDVAKTISQKRNAQAIVDVPTFMNKLGSVAVKGALTDDGTCNDSETLKALEIVFPFITGTDDKRVFKNGAPSKAIATDSKDGTFEVAHYAGTVKYTMAGFCGKSIDTLDASTRAMIDGETGSYVKDLLDDFGKNPNSSAKCGKNAQGTTTGTKFVFAVCKLMEELGKVTPHYVRCVKSNKTSEEWKFDGSICYEQLQYAGVFQAVEIRAKGFPFHPTHKEFVAKYACIVTERDGKTKEGETLKEDRGDGEALVGTEKEQAQNIFEYTLAQMDTKIKGLDKEGYKWGTTLALYKGTWHRALEHLRVPAARRADLRAQVAQGLAINPMTQDAAKALRVAVSDAKMNRVFFTPALLGDVKEALKAFAASSLPPETSGQLEQAISENNKLALAKLLKPLDRGYDEVAIVESAFVRLCELVHVDNTLTAAFKNKDEAALALAISEAAVLKYTSEEVTTATGAKLAIEVLKDQVGLALADGVLAHQQAVQQAVVGVTFKDPQTSNDLEALKGMTDIKRLVKVLVHDKDEAVRIQMRIWKARIDWPTYEAALGKFMSISAHKGLPSLEAQVIGEDDTAGQAPFTALAAEPEASKFQALLLEQAAVDNFATVKAFLTGSNDLTVQQLDELFTSCFMNECLRDELFVSILKAPDDGQRKGKLLQLALGHFGPSDNLRDFVYALANKCDAEFKLKELLARRTILGPEGNHPWTPSVTTDVESIVNGVTKQIEDTFARFETPDYKGEDWFKELTKANNILNPTSE